MLLHNVLNLTIKLAVYKIQATKTKYCLISTLEYFDEFPTVAVICIFYSFVIKVL